MSFIKEFLLFGVYLLLLFISVILLVAMYPLQFISKHVIDFAMRLELYLRED